MIYSRDGEQPTTMIDVRNACEMKIRMESRKRNIEETTYLSTMHAEAFFWVPTSGTFDLIYILSFSACLAGEVTIVF